MSTTPDANPHDSTAGHEQRDVTFRPVLWGVAGLIILLFGAILLMRALLGYLAVREARQSPPTNPLAQSFGRQVPPEPRLQTNPLRDLRELRAEEDSVLHSYGWIDRKAGVARIPIERAIELLAQRGLPARPAAGGPR